MFLLSLFIGDGECDVSVEGIDDNEEGHEGIGDGMLIDSSKQVGLVDCVLLGLLNQPKNSLCFAGHEVV